LRIGLGRSVTRVATEGILLRMGRNRTSHVSRVAARGVCGNVGVRGGKVGLFVVYGSLKPTDVLHVGHPNVLSGLSSPDSEAKQSDDISED
jgi:hypothetical protein